MQHAPRKLAVLASLDVAGYSRLVVRDTLVALARIRRKTVEAFRKPRPGGIAITIESAVN